MESMTDVRTNSPSSATVSRRSKKLSWDAPNMKFTNDDEANRYVKEPYRNGWRL
jgi:hypothetical protein